MAVPTVYRYDDASAPVLDGTVSSLIALLDACLVNGYGAKAAAGWTKPHAGTNKAAFRNDSAAGTGMYLRVLDDASGTGGARDAIVRAYSSMSDVDTGTHPAPTVAQTAVGLYMKKSVTADSTARPWILVADEKTCYLWVATAGAGVETYSFYAFGDYEALDGDTAFNYFLSARSATASTTSVGGASEHGIMGGFSGANFTSTALTTGTVTLGSDAAGTGASVRGTQSWMFGTNGGAGGGHNNHWESPEPLTLNNFWTVPYLVSAEGIRGRTRGLRYPMNKIYTVYQPEDVIVVGGETLLIVGHYGGNNSAGSVVGDRGRLGIVTGVAWNG